MADPVSAAAASQVGLSAISAIIQNINLLAKQGARHDSLVAFTQAARVEPLVLVDTGVLFDDVLPDVMQSLSNIFAGYYLQAVSLNSTIGNAKVASVLGTFNPKREFGASDVIAGASSFAAKAHHMMTAAEAYRDRLPTNWSTGIALEAQVKAGGGARPLDPDDEKFNRMKRENEMQRLEREKVERQRITASFGEDALSTLKENVNLSVGKIFEVTVKHEDRTVTVPVSIRLVVNTIPTDQLIRVLSPGDEITSSKERYHGWRAGRLAFWKDLILCRDLVDAHRKNLMADGDRLYANIVAKERKNAFAAIFHGNPSVASASNMAVMSASTVSMLEQELNGRFADFQVRQKIFERTSLMIVAVIDREWARVEFWHRGIPEVSNLGFKDIKGYSKGSSGPDVSEILRAYSMVSAPRL
ncbi:hypothetical protein P3T23_008450 [Paraburkholderia sp. GAS448]|uniref:hypothetical protein n=1 Tax=Paraburkholderia sp. GAS448 TaxID=3035136 RepID=UPI003D2478F3